MIKVYTIGDLPSKAFLEKMPRFNWDYWLWLVVPNKKGSENSAFLIAKSLMDIKDASNYIRPIVVDGINCFVVYTSPYK